MSWYDRETALLVVDVQNDFADPEGSIHVHGAEKILPVLNRELARAEAAGALVVYTQDWHPESSRHFETEGGLWPPHCLKGSWGAELHPALRRVRAATVILKGRGGEDGYSGFTVRDPLTGEVRKTALEDVLHRHRIRRVVVAGLATDWCVRHTALDALRAGFEVSVLEDGVRAVNLQPLDGAHALEEIARLGGEIVTSGEDFWQAQPAAP